MPTWNVEHQISVVIGSKRHERFFMDLAQQQGDGACNLHSVREECAPF